MISKESRQKLHRKANVTFVGIGKDKTIIGVKKKVPLASLKAADRIPSMVDGEWTDVVETGEVYAVASRKEKIRPAPGGVSIGHEEVTAGTLGMLVKRYGEVNGTPEFDVDCGFEPIDLILSNNHVLAARNKGAGGDVIYQPGILDIDSPVDIWPPLDDLLNAFVKLWHWIVKLFGGDPYERYEIGVLYDYLPIDFTEGGSNKADVALAEPLGPMLVSDLIMGILKRPTQIGEVLVGDQVTKSGRTTGVTTGKVIAVDVSVQVSYGGGLMAYFEDQFATNKMVSGGDSGSVTIKEDKAVGLVFATSRDVSFHNRMVNVVEGIGGFDL